MSEVVSQEPKLDRSGYARILQVILVIIFDAAIVFAAAGTLRWPAAWVYVAVRIVTLTIGAVFIIRDNPEIINERGRMPQDTRGFDKIFFVINLSLVLILPLVCGLDFRFAWSDMPLWLRIIGFFAYFLASTIPYWAMLVNNYLTTTVRIQEERGHHVITNGPYKYVRHPMYVGLVLGAVSMPLLLGSWWGLVPGVLMAAITIWRTDREDKVLHEELPGYAEYAQQTRYRLLPGVW
ncbi:MAG: methyltransferase family protein [Candidatus Promineifilaceae bacterium]|jgi:protein-S-isoprenylcysteine O-methyltransferase Ste14